MINLHSHLLYAKYLVRHKIFVLQARSLTGCSLWRSLTHDWSKFLPSEWFPYVDTFYGSGKKVLEVAFSQAWNAHQKRNKHHWQYWVLLGDDGSVEAVQMPDAYAREMVSDWIGAGVAITGRLDVSEWYSKNERRMNLHPETAVLVKNLIRKAQDCYLEQRIRAFVRKGIWGLGK